MLHKTLEGLKYKHSSAFLFFCRKAQKTAYCTSNCTSQLIFGHQLLFSRLILRDKKDKRTKYPQAQAQQGLRAFFDFGTKWDKK